MVTTTKVRLEADASQLKRELASIDQRLKGVSDGFGRLKSAIAGLAIGNFIAQAANAASRLDALSRSTGVAASSIRGLQQAFIANGGSTDQANDALSDLIKNIGEAAVGSGELQKTFGAVGVSLDDLRNLSEEDILAKTIEGLSKISDNATRSALGMKIFGEATKTVNLQGVNNSLAGFTQQSQGIGASSAAIAAAQANVALAFAKVADQIVLAAAPIATFVASIDNLGEKIKTVIGIALRIGVLIASFTLLGRIAAGIRTVFASLAVLGAGLQGVFLNLSVRLASGGKIAAFFADSLAWIAVKLSALAATFPKLSAFVIQFGAAIKAVAATAAAWLGIDWAGEKLDEAAKSAAENEKAQRELNKEGSATRAVQDALAAATKKTADELQGQFFALQDLTNGYRANIDAARKQYELGIANVGASERQREAAEMRLAAEQAYLSEVTKLQEKYAQTKAKVADGDKESAKLLPAISQAIQDVTGAYREQIGSIDILTQAKARALGQDQLIKFQTQEQIRLQNDLQKIADDTAKLSLNNIERKYYDIAAAAQASGRAAIEAEEARRGEKLNVQEVKAYYDAAIRGTNDLLRAQSNYEQQSRSFSNGWRQAFNDYVDEATNASKVAGRLFQKFTSGLEDAIVDFVKTGKFQWKKFVADMAEELLRAQIRKTIAGIGEAFGLGDLFGGPPGSSANNPMYVIDITGGGSGGGGGGSGRSGGSAGGLIGKAKEAAGGIWTSIKNGVASIFGGSEASEAKGGIWETIKSSASTLFNGGLSGLSGMMGSFGKSVSGLLSSAGSSLGNMANSLVKSVSGMFSGKSGGASTIGKIGSAVGSLFGGSSGKSGGSSILGSLVSGAKSLFSGFFANGGVIPAGKFGMVGERGPELISGPAGITPLQGMGGSTNVTYNISAVDAASFQALVARDPTFLFAVTEQGRKSIAGAR